MDHQARSCSGLPGPYSLYKSPSKSSVAAHIEIRFYAKSQGRKTSMVKRAWASCTAQAWGPVPPQPASCPLEGDRAVLTTAQCCRGTRDSLPIWRKMKYGGTPNCDENYCHKCDIHSHIWIAWGLFRPVVEKSNAGEKSSGAFSRQNSSPAWSVCLPALTLDCMWSAAQQWWEGQVWALHFHFVFCFPNWM